MAIRCRLRISAAAKWFFPLPKSQASPDFTPVMARLPAGSHRNLSQIAEIGTDCEFRLFTDSKNHQISFRKDFF